MSARRYPDKPFLVFYDTAVTFAEFLDEAERVAGFLEQQCGVRQGDRVLLFMQNSPQFVIAYYGILRANAVVVPLNPMNLTQEVLRYADDAQASTMIVSQELYPRIEPLLAASRLTSVIVAAYSDYLKQPTTLPVPDFIAAPRLEPKAPGVTLWRDVLASGLAPRASDCRPGRFVRHALHLRHHGATQGLHAHPPQRHAHLGRRACAGSRCSPRPR